MSLLTVLKKNGLVIATTNPGKVRELSRLLGPLGVDLFLPKDLGIHLEVEETGSTFRENAELKARALAAASGRPALADDSGLCVDAIDGRPGVLSARYGGEGLDDAGRRKKLLEELMDVPDSRRSAYFACALALAWGRDIYFFEGRADGRILTKERGTSGFGYDPVFLDPESGRSFAELSPSEKDSRSHRGRALAALIAFLENGGQRDS